MSADQSDILVLETKELIPHSEEQTEPNIYHLQHVAKEDPVSDATQPSDLPKTTRRSARAKQRRGHKYQTLDLIRELSPKPEQQIILINSEGGDVNKNTIELTAENPDPLGQSVARVEPDGQERDKSTALQRPSVTVSILNGKRTVQCTICQRHMTESRLANHIRLLHVEFNRKSDENSTAKKKEFRCEYCGKSYAIKYTFEQHVRTHTEGRPKCPECGATFASAFSLFRHRAKSHNIEHNYTTHTCDQCDKVFFSSSELALHKQRHSSEKIHTCAECKKAFSAKGNLRIHMRTHAKEKLYKCDICDNSFSHPYSLVSHRRIHTNEFPFTCTDCGKSKLLERSEPTLNHIIYS